MRSPLRAPSPLALLCVAPAAFWLACGDAPDLAPRGPGEGQRPAAEATSAPQVEHESPGFSDRATCGSCHPDALAAWSGSHHDEAMQVASAETVLGDFDDASFEQHGVTTSFRRQGDRFLVETEGPNAELAEFPVAYTFGVEPLQQYLVEFPGGHVQSLSVAWDTSAQRWFSLYPGESIEAGDPLHWTGRLQRWNVMCADCHSTALSTRFDFQAERYETDFVELDVSCQACHGPGTAHVEWARSLDPGQSVPDDADRRLVGGLAAGSAAGELDSCAPCHAHRRRVSERPQPGAPFLDHYAPSLLREELYYDDGQIDAEVYVYGSFLQSRMHQKGVRCSDCHEPHSLGLRAEGNALCVRCHSVEADARFPTLARKRYDTAEHHFHTPDSAAAACVSCHMPSRPYMQIDPRRDHSLRIPRPDLSAEIGVPNACNGCHADRDARWAADFLATRRGASSAPRADHWGEAIAAGRAGAPDAGAMLQALASSSDAPGIARATAVSLLPAAAMASDAAAEQSARTLLAAARDEDGLVRLAAARALGSLPPDSGVPALSALLRDPLRAVRLEAAHALAFLAPGAIAPAQRDAFGRALDEYRAVQRSLADVPESHLNLGALDAQRGRPGAAEEAYRAALQIDADFLPARANLANLLNAQGRNDDAEAELRLAVASAARLLARQPEDPGLARDLGQMHYSLGLLLAERQQVAHAATELGQAARLLPDLPRVQYNYGLALQQSGRRAEALPALERAASLAPDAPGFQQALAIFYAQAGDRSRALGYARRAVELSGGAQGALDLQRQIEATPGH